MSIDLFETLTAARRYITLDLPAVTQRDDPRVDLIQRLDTEIAKVKPAPITYPAEPKYKVQAFVRDPRTGNDDALDTQTFLTRAAAVAHAKRCNRDGYWASCYLTNGEEFWTSQPASR